VACFRGSHANGHGISYGINSRAHNTELDASKILFLEYTSTIARVVSPSPYNSDLANYPTKVAARHVGLFNVLYADEHLETHTAANVDPRDATIASKSWNPRTE